MGGFGEGASLVSADDFGDADVGAFLHPGGQVVGVIGIGGNPLHNGRSPEYQAFRHLFFSLGDGKLLVAGGCTGDWC